MWRKKETEIQMAKEEKPTSTYKKLHGDEDFKETNAMLKGVKSASVPCLKEREKQLVFPQAIMHKHIAKKVQE